MRREEQKPTLADRLDNAIGLISPKLGAKRKMYRSAMKLGAAYYQGARTTRLNYNWVVGQESINTTIWSELQMLRDRSRDLNRNNPVAAGITGTLCDNTIQTGITPQSRIDWKSLPITEEQAEEFQRQSEKIWEKWGSQADAAGRLTIGEIQSLAVRQILESGEFLALRRALDTDATRHYMLAIDIIEPDRLATLSGTSAEAKLGITVNDRGQPVAYDILKTHPGDLLLPMSKTGETEKIQARDPAGRPNVFHVFPMQRPGQLRGIPFFSPVLEYFKHMADYIEAEIVAARISACFAAFVKSENPYTAAVGNAETTNEKSQRVENFEPGMIEYLSPGESVDFANPTRPVTTFDMFLEKILRMIGAALGLPYELVLKDFSKTNYSSARAAMLQAYRVFKVWQKLIVDHLCQPLWDLLMEEAWLRGELVAPSFRKYRWEYCRAMWIPPGWQWVDPLKEAQANKVAVAVGFKTRADVCAEQGEDWEAKAEQASREKQRYEELGLPWQIDASKQAKASEPEEEKEERSDEGKE
jgi:lambda family phage portal protein